MEIIPKKISDYIKTHISEEPETLKELNRETYAKILMPRMLSGHEQGRVLSILSKMCKPKYILEIGTFTGYSTICLAEGLEKDGLIYTIDINEELEDFSKKYFVKVGIDHKVIQLTGDALEIIPNLQHTFDLIFLDADKKHYNSYLNLLLEKLNSGGFLIADNVLWNGKVLETNKNKDKDTLGVAEFNELVMKDQRIENIILPIRDGLNVIRKL
ncbi:MAG: O-methyltransferase [Flavobacteriaceae bacterium]|nr:O-methyltransferase [Flavobacteriaceae bacterium]